MAHYDQHCRDCERLLGDRYEDVNRWMDELYKKHGPKHRRFRHHWGGVRIARDIFGDLGAKAAIIHIVRDCGDVPKPREYTERENVLGIIIAPEVFMYDGADQTANEKFDAKVLSLFEKYYRNEF